MMDSQENAPVISPSEETVDNEVKKEEVAAQPAETPVAQTASPVETEEVQPQKVYETPRPRFSNVCAKSPTPTNRPRKRRSTI